MEASPIPEIAVQTPLVTARQRLVWLAEVPWGGLPQRHNWLVAALRERFDVTFIEPPAARTRARGNARSVDGIQVAECMPLVNSSWPPAALLLRSAPARRLAQRLAAQRVAALGGARPDVVVCSNPFFGFAAQQLRPHLLVADVADDIRHFPSSPPWTGELFQSWVRDADLVTTSSLALGDELQGIGIEPLHYVSNGVPQSLLDAGRGASRDSATRTATYVGHIGGWLDLELLARAADTLPDHCIQLVGPWDAALDRQLGALRARPNVRLLGKVAPADIPSLLSGSDAGIIPFRCTPLTRAVNPNKLYEYAALDLPIVSTAFSPDVARFGEAVDVCATPEQFVQTLRQRLNGQGLKPARSIAEQHTWEAIGSQFVAIVEEALAQRAGAAV